MEGPVQEQPFSSSPQAPPSRGLRGLRRGIEWVAHAANQLTAATLLLLILTVVAMIISRDVVKVGSAWMDDLVRYLQIWVVYAAAIQLTMTGDHIIMDAVYTRLPSVLRLFIRRCVGLLSLVVCGYVGYLACQECLELVRIGERSASGTFPAILGYASLPVGFLLMAMASVYYLVFLSRNDTYGSASVA